MSNTWFDPERFTFRFIAYLLLVAGCFVVMNVMILTFGWRSVLKEGALLEWVQVIVIGITLVGLAVLAIRAQPERPFTSRLPISRSWLSFES